MPGPAGVYGYMTQVESCYNDGYSMNFKCTQYLLIYCLLVSGPTTCAHMQNSSTQATSVKAAVLAGLGIAASILLL